jgi:uncharacterized protein
MEVSEHDPGVPCWVDVGTDLDKGRAFYGALFGWECPEGSPETGFYSTATLRGRRVAGLGPQQEGMPSFWTTYVGVEGADEVAKKVASAGGQTLLAPMDVMEFGRMAIFADPAGAAFGVWQPGSHRGAEIVNEPGAYSWSELVTTDVGGAKRFYEAVFGWGSSTQSAGPMEYTEWKLAERSIGGMMPKPEMMPAEVPPHWAVDFAVADLDDATAKVKDLGGAVLAGPIDSPAGRLAPVMDAHGAPFNVIELRAGATG